MKVEAFIARWSGREGGAERANYQMFLAELCDVIEVARPEPAGAERERNDYVFERAVRRRQSDPVAASRRIDLYKKGCFILEAKQSRLPGARNALPDQLALPDLAPAQLGRRGAGRNWDAMMSAARRQAEDYVFLLDGDHPAPPFLITCDVGHALELYADFSGNGRRYEQFGGRQGFRVYLEDLRRPETRALLRAVWTDPASLDPTRQSARVTRQIAERLAAVTRALERKHPAEDVALFVMRCIFCMFAEDVDLLPRGRFTELLEDCTRSPRSLVPLLEELWSKLDEPDRDRRYFSYFHTHLRHFNGSLYRDARAYRMEAEEIGELLAASRHDWREVDPAIFGTLLEQALDPAERKRLGAHYTPRAYVARLVEATVIAPLREDWRTALAAAHTAKDEGKEKDALAILRAFHRKLCATRVLDPACGTGNFLYVSLQLMKTLEGEVLEALAELGASEMLGLDAETVSPRQFLGLEINPRAAAIAELVVWIGFLQEHYRTHSGHPGEPILRAFANINFGRKEGCDAVLSWRDGRPERPDWPEAEFIVGNPPFIGKGAAMRSALGDAYVEALWKAHPQINESADFVMYWWDRAAELLVRKGTALRRFGLVTTNSISQVFNRRTIERHLGAKDAISIVFTVPDHPWTKATKDAAAVRIAMTVAEAGERMGSLVEISAESGLRTDEPQLSFTQRPGRINADLSAGADLTRAPTLLANSGLSWNGMMLAARGFVIDERERAHLDAIDPAGTPGFVRPFASGSDLLRRPKRNHVIDFSGLEADAARRSAPAAYAHLIDRVKPDRDKARDKAFRERWWLFGRTRPDLRAALGDMDRYIGTTETAKHRIFQFIDGEIVPDHMIIAIASDDAAHLSILSSHIHKIWALAAGGWLGVGNDPRYSKSRCFDPFPFPDPSPALRDELRAVGEELDATRKRVLEDHPDLTMTGLYNVLETVKSGTAPGDREEDVKARGLVLILKELHETIDRLTAEAYGWASDLSDAEILARLVALNAARAAEEAEGHVRWLRPDFQAPRFSRRAAGRTGRLALDENVVAIDRRLPLFPARREEQVLAVASVLAASRADMSAADMARAFRRGGRRMEPRIARLLVSLARYGHVVALGDGRFRARETDRIAA